MKSIEKTTALQLAHEAYNLALTQKKKTNKEFREWFERWWKNEG